MSNVHLETPLQTFFFCRRAPVGTTEVIEATIAYNGRPYSKVIRPSFLEPYASRQRPHHLKSRPELP